MRRADNRTGAVGRVFTVLRTLGMVAIVTGVVGCAALEETFEPVGEAEPRTAPAAPEPAEAYSYNRVLQLLQEGEEMDAHALVLDRLDEAPDDERALDLREQIEEPPEEVLGADYFIHEVETGESLAMLADRYLGEPDRFYILARYNDIDVPRRLAVGAELRIPDWYADAPREGDPEAEAEREAERAMKRAEVALEAGDKRAAKAAFQDVLTVDPEHEEARREVERLREELALDLHREAVLLYRNEELDPAIELWDEALELDPDFDRARDYRGRAEELRSRLEDVD